MLFEMPREKILGRSLSLEIDLSPGCFWPGCHRQSKQGDSLSTALPLNCVALIAPDRNSKAQREGLNGVSFSFKEKTNKQKVDGLLYRIEEIVPLFPPTFRLD